MRGFRAKELKVSGLRVNGFLDNTTYSKTKSVHFLGIMNSATKYKIGERLPCGF